MGYYTDLRVLTESTGSNTVLGLLGRTTAKSSVLLTKAAVIFAKDITKAKMEKDPDAKRAAWKHVRQEAVAMRKAANELPPDTISDHTWRLITSPWWMSAYSYGKVALTSDELSDMTKDSVIDKFDALIAYADREINKL